jgi:hypothetical protein
MSRNFDVIEGGEVVLSVRTLWPEEPVECCVCGNDTFSRFCVPYYCEPVREGQSEAGYSHACEPCYHLWERWSETTHPSFYRWRRANQPPVLFRPAHGGYPGEVTNGVDSTLKPVLKDSGFSGGFSDADGVRENGNG